MRSNELPDAALHLIQGLALGRHVGGTNKYAAVCRSWRKASQLRDYEPLRLLVDLHGASYDQLDTATAWFARYGSQVQHLVHSTYVSPSWPVLQQLWVSPRSFHGLTRLEVEGRDSLVNLAPLLVQLPKLQHLKACISLEQEQLDGPGVCHAGDDNPQARALPVVPVLQELCPQLCALHLVMDSHSTRMDPRLPQLLPCGLQQLRLDVAAPFVLGHPLPPMDPAWLASCSRLQRLTLQGVHIDQAFTIASKPSIHLVDAEFDSEEVLLRMQGRLVQLLARTEPFDLSPSALGQLTALTALTLCNMDRNTTPIVHYDLTRLTALRHLEVRLIWDSNQLPMLLQQLAGMPQLRSLRLDGRHPHAAIAGMTALTQLTGLYTTRLPHTNLDTDNQGQEGNPWPGILQQLPGLQSLEVQPELVVNRSNQPWWTALAALTQLAVQSLYDWDVEGALMDQDLRAVQAALAATPVPASLRHLVFVVNPDAHEGGAAYWSHKPSRQLPGVTVTCVKLRPRTVLDDLTLPGTPCPWLPGVWERLGDP